MSRIYHWINSNGIVSLAVVIWMLLLVTWVTVRSFGANPPNIPGTTAGALATIYGLPAVAIGLYKWRAGRGQKNARED